MPTARAVHERSSKGTAPEAPKSRGRFAHRLAWMGEGNRAPTPPVSGGYVGYSVSGYVNGYNPTLPAYPPTRAQMQAAARNGGERRLAGAKLGCAAKADRGVGRTRAGEIRISRDRDHRIT